MASRPMTLTDFHPASSHLMDCPKTTVGSMMPCTRDCVNHLYAVAASLNGVVVRLREEQDSVDRQARAFGWEVGQSDTPEVVPRLVNYQKDNRNPFRHPDWRERAGLKW